MGPALTGGVVGWTSGVSSAPKLGQPQTFAVLHGQGMVGWGLSLG